MSRRAYPGRAASGGTALGFLYRVDRPLPDAARGTGGPDSAGADGAGAESAGVDAAGRIGAAFDAVAAQLLELAETLRAEGAREQADIMEVGSFIAQDPGLRGEAVERAGNGQPVHQAVQRAVDAQADTLARLDDPTLAERSADVRQVGRRVLAHLHGVAPAPAGQRPLVLAAHEIGAADLLEPGRKVTAALTVAGGPNSHAAIVARSLGVPLLIGVDPALLDLPDGAEILLDAERATAVAHPDDAERAEALRAVAAAAERRRRLAEGRRSPAETADGRRIVLRANAATRGDAEAALHANAEGVGLLRTELPFLHAETWPTQAQHTAVLDPVLRALRGQVVVARTLDFADDKLPPFLARGRAGRLGRGLPLMLGQPDAFADQFRGLLRAGVGAGTDLRIMIPMVAEVGELRACRALLERAAVDAGVPVPPLGIMVELPEAVERADELAREADFFSIGSNDLTSQILGLDRRDPAATPDLAAHPEVLRAVDRVVRAAHRHRRRVSVCGDAAAHPLVAPLLIGLDCDSLSVSPAALDEIRALIRRLRHDECVTLAAEAMLRRTPAEVWGLVRQRCAPALI